MIPFEARDPYPHLKSFSKSEAQLHATQVDRWLGLDISTIEEKLRLTGSRLPPPREATKDKQELWFGLAPQDLVTPYIELRSMLEELSPRSGETVVDLGAAYGRMGLVLARHFPRVNFIGYEYVAERVRAGQAAMSRARATNATLEQVDLANPQFRPASGEYYFIYDFGTDKAIEKILYDLKRLSLVKPLTLIARGRRCRYAIDRTHQWLIKNEAQEAVYTIYRSVTLSRDLVESAV